MAPRSHPPAWYPDPRDPRRVRRWDGRAWTHEVRPLPDWLRTLRLAPGPAARGRHRRSSRWLWLASSGLLLVGAVLMVVLTPSGPDVAVVDDTAFVRAAEARCRAVRRDAAATPDDDAAAATLAGRVDARTREWEALVTDLGRLEVARADRPAVLDWLAAWDLWTDLRRSYAQALEAGDVDGSRALLDQLAEARAAVSRFAVANRMPACALSPAAS